MDTFQVGRRELLIEPSLAEIHEVCANDHHDEEEAHEVVDEGL